MPFSAVANKVLGSRSEPQGVDYKERVVPWIEACFGDGGTPMFRTKYGGELFKNKVMGVCHGGKNKVKSQWFINVPEEDIYMMASGTGDWQWIVVKYGTKPGGAEPHTQETS